ncbi:MAG: TIGR04211 family SH3 domain-containing protein [Desulfobacterium sp.]|nr:TIGR04211 family SH3 domain-containing protein [Desulfobacterium sp.]
MKSALNLIVFVLTVLILNPGSTFGETVYVKGVMKITMRTGPGVEHKIVAMVESGDTLEVVEFNRDWSRVRNSNGKEGWVLTRYVTTDVPVTLVAATLKRENTVLKEALDKVRVENADLAGVKAKFETLENSYSLLKKEAAEFLSLKEKYREMTQTFEDQQVHIAALERRLGKEEIKWFLSGAGVLVAGIILGISAKKKKRSSFM